MSHAHHSVIISFIGRVADDLLHDVFAGGKGRFMLTYEPPRMLTVASGCTRDRVEEVLSRNRREPSQSDRNRVILRIPITPEKNV